MQHDLNTYTIKNIMLIKGVRILINDTISMVLMVQMISANSVRCIHFLCTAFYMSIISQ